MSRAASCRAHRSAGFTMVELLFSMSLFAIVLTAVSMVSATSNNLMRYSSDASRLETKGRQAVDRVVAELSTVMATTMNPSVFPSGWTQTLDFNCAIGLAGVMADPGPLQRLRFEYEAADGNDGIDNDSDGLVDEGTLVFTRDQGGPDEQRITLCTGVAEYTEGELPNGLDDNGNGLIDERGFYLQQNNGLVSVHLTLVDTGKDNSVITRSVATSLRVRN